MPRNLFPHAPDAASVQGRLAGAEQELAALTPAPDQPQPRRALLPLEIACLREKAVILEAGASGLEPAGTEASSPIGDPPAGEAAAPIIEPPVS